MGDTNVRDEDRIELSDRARQLLEKEKALEVAELRKEADRIEQLTPLEYLGRGIRSYSARTFELAGRMSRSGFSTVDYDWGKPGWQVQSGGYERYVTKESIQAIFEIEENDR